MRRNRHGISMGFHLNKQVRFARSDIGPFNDIRALCVLRKELLMLSKELAYRLQFSNWRLHR
jgi:hypothetical protein